LVSSQTLKIVIKGENDKPKSAAGTLVSAALILCQTSGRPGFLKAFTKLLLDKKLKLDNASVKSLLCLSNGV